MGKFTNENQGTNSYLVYTLSEQEGIDSMSLGMITNNKIPGLASTMFMQMNATKYIKYNVSSKIPMSQFFSGPVTKKRLLGVFGGIVDAVLSAEDYMIDANTLLMDPDFIYVDVSTCETALLCLPVEDKEGFDMDLHLFFKKIMFETQFDQTEDCTYIAKIINYLNSTYQFSLAEFKALLEESKDSTGRAVSAGTQASGIDLELVGSHSQHPLEPKAISYGQYPSEPFQPGVQTPLPPVKEVQLSQREMERPQPAPLKEGNLSGLVLPPSQKATEVSAGTDGNPVSDQKPMSLYYLLRHYDKENAEIYKKQKEEEKLKKDAQKSDKKAAKKTNKKTDKKKKGFAIPGQGQTPVNIPMPGSTGEVPVNIPALPKEAVQPQAPAWQTPRNTPDQQPVGQNAPIPVAMQPVSQPTFPSGGGVTDSGFGDTVMEFGTDESSETVIFMPEAAEQQVRPHLIRRRNNERIPINQTIFRLGRNFDFNDYVIAENEFIGNSHCHILIRNEEYFIVDDNSKNHTYVDGVMVSPGTEVKLSHGQVIRLANEEFEFRLF